MNMSSSDAQGRAAAFSLCAAWILADGRAKLLFEDNSILLLSATGLQFAYISPEGARTRQLSDFALRRFSRHLTTALRLRNLHSDVPAYPTCLRQQMQPGSAFRLGYPIADLAWPTDPEDAIGRGLVEFLPGGRVSVRSRCSSGRIVLDANGARFAVRFPLLLDQEAASNAYTYTWHSQVFSTTQHPPRWRPAVLIAQAVASNRDRGFPLRCTSPGNGAAPQPPTLLQQADAAGASALCRPLTAGLEAQAPAAWGVMALPPARGGSGSCSGEHAADDVPGDEDGGNGSWWAEPTRALPAGQHVLLAWTPEATYVCPQGAGEVEAWLHANDSCMASTQGGAFMQHWIPGEQDPRVYAAGAVPDAVTCMVTGQRLVVGQVVAHALQLRSAMAAVAAIAAADAARAAAPPATAPLQALVAGPSAGGSAAAAPRAAGASAPSGQVPAPRAEAPHWRGAAAPTISNQPLEEQEVAGVGRFLAFTDGRVKVAFADRTLLHSDADGSTCRLLLPDGRAVVVAVSRPVGVEAYVRVAVEFRAWALRTPAERAQLLRLQAAVQSELRNSARMARVCDWAANKALPADGVGASAALGAACRGADAPALGESMLAAYRPASSRQERSPPASPPPRCGAGVSAHVMNEQSAYDEGRGAWRGRTGLLDPSVRQHVVRQHLIGNAAAMQRMQGV